MKTARECKGNPTNEEMKSKKLLTWTSAAIMRCQIIDTYNDNYVI